MKRITLTDGSGSHTHLLNLRPIDVGLDLRLHDMVVQVPGAASDTVVAEILDPNGEHATITGGPRSIVSRLRKLGFKAARAAKGGAR